MRCLEIGISKDPHPVVEGQEWETMDMDPNNEPTYCALWGHDKIPVSDRVYDFVYASHVIEHIPWYWAERALAEVLRVLKPGGVFEVWTPDFGKIVEAWQKGECGDQWRTLNPKGDSWKWLCGRLFAYNPAYDGRANYESHNWHRAIFDKSALTGLLEKVGFVDVEEAKSCSGREQPPTALGLVARRFIERK